jgi:hypothetical protein
MLPIGFILYSIIERDLGGDISKRGVLAWMDGDSYSRHETGEMK